MPAQSVASGSIESPPLITGPWTLADLRAGKIGSPQNGFKVFSTFHCGGGSSMGYKLAGFDVIGGVEIDPRMMAVYRENLKPREECSFLMGLQDFNKIPDKDLPAELFGIDVLDGSPPCSTFSMSGNREADWGRSRKFAEGQADQVLDDLFFTFIDTVRKLRPKVVIAENVKGMLLGNAKWYVKKVITDLRSCGYDVQLFLLNAAVMGVPQKRERVFFIARRKDLNIPDLNLQFNEPIISCESAFRGINAVGRSLTPDQAKWWPRVIPGFPVSSVHPKGHWFNAFKLRADLPSPTLSALGGNAENFHWKYAAKISDAGIMRLQSFPDDYSQGSLSTKYICGMSVPPLMVQRIASRVSECLLKTK